MSKAVTRLRKIVVERAVTTDRHRAAFANAGVEEPARALIDKVSGSAYKITDEDIAAVKAAGYSEDAVFELTVCGALGQATRQLDAALAALDAATEETP